MPQKFGVPAFFPIVVPPPTPAPPNPTACDGGYHHQLLQSQPSGWIIVLGLDVQDFPLCPIPTPPSYTTCRPAPTDPNFVPSFAQEWRDLTQCYQNPGPGLATNIVLGYVATDDGTGASNCTNPLLPTDAKSNRSEQNIKDYIDYWYQVVPNLDGIFFDEGPAPYRFTGNASIGPKAQIAQCVKDLYSHLYQYVKAKPVRPGRPPVAGNTGGAMLLNAAGYEEDPGGDWIMVGANQACDIAILWETNACQYFVTESSQFGTNVWPAPPPSWWTNLAYAPDRVAHTIYACHNTHDMQQVIALSNHRGPNGGIAAQYVFVIDSDQAVYGHLPPYWNDELAAVAAPPSLDPTLPVLRSVATSKFYVRDWTDSSTIYDTGQEPSTNPVFWTTSDVWNRRSNALGVFNANNQPQNEGPVMDAQGNNTNFAFARIHRAPCATNTVESVTAHFLWADFGMGSNFQDVSATPTTTVTFPNTVPQNTPDLPKFEQITPGVQWSLPATASPHICLAVEISAPQDPFKTDLKGQPAGSVSNALVLNDNNLAQRNLSVVRLSPSPALRPFSHLAIAHNGDPFPRTMTLTYEVPAAVRELLGEATIEVINEHGKRTSRPFKPGDKVPLEGMQPGENRWIGLTAHLQGGREGEFFPVTFSELVDNRVVNGFSIAVQLAPLSTVILDNLRLHAMEFRRLAATAQIGGAEEESKVVLEVLRTGDLTSQDYLHFVQSRLQPMDQVVAQWGRLQEGGDPFTIQTVLKHLTEAIASGKIDLVLAVHNQMLQKLDAFLTMQHKAQGDAADILQMVRWQYELYRTLPHLQAVKGSPHLVEESEAFLAAYQARRLGNEEYPRLIDSLLQSFRQTAEAIEEGKLHLEQTIAAMERHVGSLPRLQKAHRTYLLKLQALSTKQ